MTTLIGYVRAMPGDDPSVVAGQLEVLRNVGCTDIAADSADGWPDDGPALAGLLGQMTEDSAIVIPDVGNLPMSYRSFIVLTDALGDRDSALKCARYRLSSDNIEDRFIMRVLAARTQCGRDHVEEARRPAQ